MADQFFKLSIGIEVTHHFALTHTVQWWLRDVHITGIQNWTQVTVNQRQQQCPNVRAVDIGIGHDNQLVVAGLANVKVLTEAGAHGREQRPDFFVGQNAFHAGLFNVQNLPPNWQDGLRQTTPTTLSGTAGGVPFDDEQFGDFWVLAGVIRQLPRQAGNFQSALAPRHFTRPLSSQTRLACEHCLVDDELGVSRVLHQVLVEVLAEHAVRDRPRIRVTKLGLGLSFKLRVRVLDGDNRGHPLTHVIPRQRVVVRLQRPTLAGVSVDDTGERRLEPGLMCPTFVGVDVVGKSQQLTRKAIRVLQGDFNGDTVLLAFNVNGFWQQRFLPLVEEFNVVAQTAFVVELQLFSCVLPLVGKGQTQTLVQECQFANPGHQNFVVVNRRLGEDVGIRHKMHLGAVFGFGRITNDVHWLVDLATLEGNAIAFAATRNFNFNVRGQGVHNGRTNPVQTTGHLVTAAAKLTTGVQNGVHGFQRWPARLLLDVNWNPAAIIGDGDGVVFLNFNVNGRGKTS